MPQLAASPLKIGTLRRLTAEHPFFAGWDVDRLKRVEAYTQVVEAAAGGTVLDLGAMDPYAYFLMEGELGLEDAAGARRQVRAGDLDAGFPVAHLRPSRYRVEALPGTRLLRIEGSRLRRLTTRGQSASFAAGEGRVGGGWRAHPLVAVVTERLRDGRLPVPAMPAIALRIRRALARENCNLSEVAAIVSADPAIAGRLIRVANSAALGGRSSCETVQAALVRLGIERAQSLVLVLATRDLFASRAPFLKERMAKRWRRAIDVGALAGILAGLTPGLQAERGLLIGLLHEIGALPILGLAESYRDLAGQPELLDEIVDALTPEVSAQVLEQWAMPDAFCEAALSQGNWFREHEGDADYTDVLVVAHLHRLVLERSFRHLPRIDETPAFGKLALGMLSPQLSLQVLDQARAQVQELKSLLT